MGFWGLNKVIERHVYDREKLPESGAAFTVLAEPVAGRDQLVLVLARFWPTARKSIQNGLRLWKPS